MESNWILYFPSSEFGDGVLQARVWWSKKKKEKREKERQNWKCRNGWVLMYLIMLENIPSWYRISECTSNRRHVIVFGSRRNIIGKKEARRDGRWESAREREREAHSKASRWDFWQNSATVQTTPLFSSHLSISPETWTTLNKMVVSHNPADLYWKKKKSPAHQWQVQNIWKSKWEPKMAN